MVRLATLGWDCWHCPDGGVGFSAYSTDCGALRRLQMALVKMSSKLAPLARRVAEVDVPERHDHA